MPEEIREKYDTSRQMTIKPLTVVQARFDRRFGSIDGYSALWGFIGFVVILLVGAVIQSLNRFAGISIMVVCSLGLFVMLGMRERAKEKKAAAELENELIIADALDEFVLRSSVAYAALRYHEFPTDAFARVLFGKVKPRSVFIVHRTGQIGIPTAITESFEPRELDESDPKLRELSIDDVEVAKVEKHYEMILNPSVLRSNLKRQGKFFSFMACGIFGMKLAQDYLTEGVVSWWMIPMFAVGLFTLFSRRGIATNESCDVLLIPGGLLLRYHKTENDVRHLAIMRATECILVAHQTQKKGWKVCIAGENALKELLLTDVELRILLMAWGSPHVPPDVSRFSDFS